MRVISPNPIIAVIQIIGLLTATLFVTQSTYAQADTAEVGYEFIAEKSSLAGSGVFLDQAGNMFNIAGAGLILINLEENTRTIVKSFSPVNDNIYRYVTFGSSGYERLNIDDLDNIYFEDPIDVYGGELAPYKGDLFYSQNSTVRILDPNAELGYREFENMGSRAELTFYEGYVYSAFGSASQGSYVYQADIETRQIIRQVYIPSFVSGITAHDGYLYVITSTIGKKYRLEDLSTVCLLYDRDFLIKNNLTSFGSRAHPTIIPNGDLVISDKNSGVVLREKSQTPPLTAPVAGSLPDVTVDVGTQLTVNLATGFEGDSLSYTVSGLNGSSVVDSTLTVTVAEGTSTVNVTATNSAGSATVSFTLTGTVPNTSPTVSSAPANDTVDVGTTKNYNLSNYFSDAENNITSYTLTLNGGNATVSQLPDGTFDVTFDNVGTVDLTAQATDAEGLSASVDFTVLVEKTGESWEFIVDKGYVWTRTIPEGFEVPSQKSGNTQIVNNGNGRIIGFTTDDTVTINTGENSSITTSNAVNEGDTSFPFAWEGIPPNGWYSLLFILGIVSVIVIVISILFGLEKALYTLLALIASCGTPAGPDPEPEPQPVLVQATEVNQLLSNIDGLSIQNGDLLISLVPFGLQGDYNLGTAITLEQLIGLAGGTNVKSEVETSLTNAQLTLDVATGCILLSNGEGIINLSKVIANKASGGDPERTTTHVIVNS